MFLQDKVVVPRPLLGHEAAVAAEDLGLDLRRHLVGAAAPGWRAACKEIRADDLGRYIRYDKSVNIYFILYKFTL